MKKVYTLIKIITLIISLRESFSLIIETDLNDEDYLREPF